MSLAFGFNSDNLVRDWALLVSSTVRSDTWRVNRVITDADQFWANVLRDNTITWTNLTRRFIPQKSLLRESIMKILINGPGDVEQFDSSLYAFRSAMVKNERLRDPALCLA
ncbi:unnamed protein product [Orchesella dallaii]|uniref:Uncharacterized protein n=1 Tax=Orchesella dallaii TaxID=48710 RepID=A0ABP1RGR0_9HEXA